MPGGVNDRLERVRKPRVHIKYEVETEGPMAETDEPYVVGRPGDVPVALFAPLSEREFVQIDRDNFDEVMARLTSGGQTPDAAGPAAAERQAPALKALLAARDDLRERLTRADRTEDLEELLERILQNHDALKAFSSGLRRPPSNDAGPS